MSIINSNTVSDNALQSNGTRFIYHIFTDHLDFTYGPIFKIVPGTWTQVDFDNDRAAEIILFEYQLAVTEVIDALDVAKQGINPDRIPDHQTQAEFDRRLLGRAMLINDIHTFNAIYPMFQAVESRGGANAIQRASYLGISTTEYNLIADRFNPMAAVQVMLSEQKTLTWNDLPEVFE